MNQTPTISQTDVVAGRPVKQSRLAFASTSLGALLLALATAGCAQKAACPDLGTCGGPLPVGDWVLSPGHPACSEQLYQAPPDPRLARGDQPAARLPLPEEAFYDWCDALIFKGDDPQSVDANHLARFSFSDQAIGAGYVHYDGSGNYAAVLTKTGTYFLDFPPVCVRGFGAVDDATGGVCTQVQQYLATKSTVGKNITCLDSALDVGGCACRFDISLQAGGVGQYLVGGNTIKHQLTGRLPDKSDAADFPALATYCNKGSSLQLTGKDGAYLFNIPGLRTLDLSPTTINCTDGVKGPGEDGIDCGIACPMPCMP